MRWETTEYGFHLEVPIKSHCPDASYDIGIARRPVYCDRGDWLIHVDGRNDLDSSDGFPRYFIGSAVQVKKQMELWLSRRAAYRDQLMQEAGIQSSKKITS